MHQILPGTRILPGLSEAGRTTAPTGLTNRSRHSPGGKPPPVEASG
jgi:hypothetical protein